MSLLLSSYNQLLKSKPLLITSLTTGFCYGLGDLLAQSIEIRQGTGSISSSSSYTRSGYDLYRLGVMTMYGTVLGGPIYYFWFAKIERMPKFLEKVISWNEKRILVQHFSRELSERLSSNSISDMSMKLFRNNYKTAFDKIEKPIIRSKTVLVAKIYADQFIFSPLYIGFFLFTTSLMMDVRNYNVKESLFPQVSKTVSQTWQSLKNKFFHIYVTDCAVWPLAQMANFAFIPPHLQPIFVNIINVGWNTFLSYASMGH